MKRLGTKIFRGGVAMLLSAALCLGQFSLPVFAAAEAAAADGIATGETAGSEIAPSTVADGGGTAAAQSGTPAGTEEQPPAANEALGNDLLNLSWLMDQETLNITHASVTVPEAMLSKPVEGAQILYGRSEPITSDDPGSAGAIGWQAGREFTGLQSDTVYAFFAKAVDAGGNQLTAIASQIVTTGAMADKFTVKTAPKLSYVEGEGLDMNGLVLVKDGHELPWNPSTMEAFWGDPAGSSIVPIANTTVLSTSFNGAALSVSYESSEKIPVGTLTVTAATPAKTITMADSDVVYSGQPQGLTAVVSDGGTATVLYYTDAACTAGETATAPTNAGTYYGKAWYAGAADAVAKLTIRKVDTRLTLNGGETFTYNGQPQMPAAKLVTADGAELPGVPVDILYYYMNVTEVEAPTDAGDYRMEANFDGNENCNGASPLFMNFTINPAQRNKVPAYVTTLLPGTAQSGTITLQDVLGGALLPGDRFSSSMGTPTAVLTSLTLGADGALHYTTDPNTVNGDRTIALVAVTNPNYTTIGPELEFICATPVITMGGSRVTYNGQPQGLTATVSDGGTATVRYYTNEACTEGETDKAPTNAGVYYAKASYPNAADVKATLTIDKADRPAMKAGCTVYLLPGAAQTGTVNLAELFPTSAPLAGDSIRWASLSEPMTLLRSAAVDASGGLYYETNELVEGQTALCMVRIESDNYNGILMPLVKFVCGKAPATIPNSVDLDKPYDGQPVVIADMNSFDAYDTYSNVITEDIDWTFTFKDASDNVLSGAPTDAGSYKLVVSMESEHYTGKDVYPFTIAKKEITVSIPTTYRPVGSAKLGDIPFKFTGLVGKDTAKDVLPTDFNVVLINGKLDSVSHNSSSVLGPGTYVIQPDYSNSSPLKNYTVIIDSSYLYLTVRAQNNYQFLEGTKQTIVSGGSMTVRVDCPFEKYVGEEVDKKVLSLKDRFVWEGSTYVQLKASYLRTLAAGQHTLRINFTDGYAETTFTLKGDAAAPVTPEGNYTIRGSWSDGGKITSPPVVSVAPGGTAIFTMAADTGYSLRDVLVDGVSVGAVSQYTFEAVHGDHTIQALFKKGGASAGNVGVSGIPQTGDTGVNPWVFAVIGGVAVIGVAAGAWLYFRRRKK